MVVSEEAGIELILHLQPALYRLGARPDEAVMVGDRGRLMLSAHAAPASSNLVQRQPVAKLNIHADVDQIARLDCSIAAALLLDSSHTVTGRADVRIGVDLGGTKI